MKKLRILVVDDTQANIEAAKVASNEFPQHEFVFMTSANEAFKQIEKFDAVVTDLFFPEKPCEEMMETYEKMQEAYSAENYNYKKVVGNAYHLFPPEILKKNISIVRNGLTVSKSNKPLDEPEFPLGISIMLKAKSFWGNRGFEKKFCLISDIHCHGSADGQIILLPLVGPLNVDSLEHDGDSSFYYMGSGRIASDKGKIDPYIWEKAIHCLLAQ